MLGTGSHIVSVNDVYGGTFRYLTKVASTNGISVNFVNMTDDGEAIRKAWRPETKVNLIFCGIEMCSPFPRPRRTE